MSKNFLKRCLQGEALIEEIDDFVEERHHAKTALSISEFLGFTPDEYALWVEKPEILSYIIFARKNGVSLEDAIGQSKNIAARGQSQGETKTLLKWLKQTSRIS